MLDVQIRSQREVIVLCGVVLAVSDAAEVFLGVVAERGQGCRAQLVQTLRELFHYGRRNWRADTDREESNQTCANLYMES